MSSNGNDNNSGVTFEKPFKTIAYALTQITPGANQILQISAGEYEETFPLSIPIGVTVRGAGQRATLIKPTQATETNDCFLLDDRTTVEDLTIGGMYKPQGAANNNYAFRFKTGADIQNRSPYVQRVTVINRGTQVTASDPYGYGSADAYPTTAPGGAGVLVDGSVVTSASLEAAILLNEVTLFPAGNIGIEMTNGARVEWLNGFIYFASEGVRGQADLTTGLHGAGQARLSLDNASGGLTPGNSIIYYDSDGTTQLASGTIDSVSGNYIYLTNAGVGTFAVPFNRTAKNVSFVDGAEITTAQKKFGTASLDCTSSSTDAINVDTNADFGFGTGDFTIDFWIYQNATGNNKTFLDMRKANDSDVALSLQEVSGATVDVEISGSAVINGTQTLTQNVWHHIALTREGSTLRLFVDGVADGSVTNSTDLGLDAPFRLGDKHDNTGGIPGFFDEVRVQKGVAKYTAAFTPPTSEYQGDKDTVLLLHFNDANGATATTDDILVYQDIRITGGNTADKVTLADYHEFGADLRSVACAIEYGNKGIIGDGNGVTLRVISINFNHVGALGDITNDPNLAIQANEVTELNGGEVSFVSIDQKGDLRVGDAFFVNQETGEVSFQDTVTDLTALSSLTITNGTQSSIITPTSGRFGNVLISGQSVESVTGDLDLKAAGNGEINIFGDTNVIGVLTAQVIEINAIQNGNTSIALDDTGPGSGVIRFNTDGVEAMRLDESQHLGIGTQAPRSELDVMNQTRLEDLFVSGIATIGGAEITPGGGGAISVKELNVSGVATINVGIITEAVIGVATITNADITFANIDESVTGLATITDLVGTAATIGTLDVTTIDIEGIDAEVAVIRDLTVTGFSTLADMSAEDATFDSITVTDLSVTGPTTATSVEATSITTPVANITDAVVGTSSVTTANVGFVTFIDAVGTALTVHELEAYRGKFEFIEFESGGGGGGSGGGTGINSTSVRTQDLLVTGIATFTTGFTTHLTAEGISAGVVTVTDIVSSGVSTLATIKNVDLTVSGVATINHEEVGSSVIGVATITTLDAGTVSIDGIDADVVVTDDLVAGVATITQLEATDTVGTAATFQNLNFITGVGTQLTLVQEEVGVSTIGVLTAGDVVINNLVVLGDTNLGVTTGIVIIDGPATISGVVTIGDNSITLDGRQGREYIELGTGSGVRIAGLNTFTNAQSYVEVFNGLFTNLNVSGISTLGSVGVDTLTVSELTVDEITATDAVVGTATITSADIDSASVGFITATDIVATAITAFTANFDILDFGEGPGGGGTGIDSTSIQTENLLITGIATINSGIFTSIQSENINVSGTTTSVNIDATTIDTTNLTAEVGAITNLVNTNLVSSGIATLNEVVAGILTVGSLDANVIEIDNVDADNAVIGLATITEELVGISTIGFADITDAQIGAATITNLSATTIDIDGFDAEVGRLIDLEVTGIATIADLEAGNTRLGITTVTGFLDVVGYTTVSGDLTIGGNLNVEGDLSYDEVNGRNANITGIGTVNELNWTTAVGGALTVTGTSDLAHVDAESLSVSGLSTFVGVATFQDDLYVGGNIFIEGDLSYDEVNGRNANITGVGTVNHLNWNTAVGGAFTVTGISRFEDRVDVIDSDLYVDRSVNVGAAVTARYITATGIETTEVSTFAGPVSISGLTSTNATLINTAEVGVATINTLQVTDIVGTSATFTNLDASNIEFEGGTGIGSELIQTPNLIVVGVATIGEINIQSGVASLSSAVINNLTFTDAVGAGLTVATGIFTDINVSGAATFQSLTVNDINIQGGDIDADSVTTDDLLVTGLSTFVGVATFQDDIYIGGNLNIQGDLSYDEVNGRNANITGVGTVNHLNWTTAVGGATTISRARINDLQVGVVTITGRVDFDSGIGTGGGGENNTGISSQFVTTPNLEVTGIATINHLEVQTVNAGVVTAGRFVGMGSELTHLRSPAFTTSFPPTVRRDGTPLQSGDIYYDDDDLRTFIYYVDVDSAQWVDASPQSPVSDLSVIVGPNSGSVDLGNGFIEFEGVANQTQVSISTILDAVTVTVGLDTNIVINGNLDVIGITTLADFSAEDITVNTLVATSATITNLEVQNLNAIGGGELGIDTIAATTGIFTSLNVSGFATFAQDMFVGGIATISSLKVGQIETLGGGGLNVDSVTTNDLVVSGLSTFVGVATFQDDIYIGGNLNIQGDLSYDEVNGRNANISGVGTVNRLYVTTDADVGNNLIVSGVSSLGVVTATDLTLDDIYTNGAVSIGGSLTMRPTFAGNGGVFFDESVVGVGTLLVNNRSITYGNATFDAQVVINGNTFAKQDLVVDGNNFVAKDFVGTGATSTLYGFNRIITLGNISAGGIVTGREKVDTDFLVTRDLTGVAGTITTLDVTTLNADNLTIDGALLDTANIVDLGVTGIATINQVEIQSGIATLDSAVIGIATITVAGIVNGIIGTLEVIGDQSIGRNLSVGGLSTFVGDTKTFGDATFKQDVIIEGNLFTSGGGGGISTDGTTGITSTSISTQDLYVSGIATAQTADILGDLLVRGNARVVGVVTAENVDTLSDKRLKQKIRKIEDPLEKVSKINGVHFNFINSGKKSMGVIAQEVEDVFPELISGTLPKSVNYNGLIGLLIESVKELKEQNEQLRKDIDDLKKS